MSGSGVGGVGPVRRVGGRFRSGVVVPGFGAVSC